jgi:hypothetical protein
MMTAANPDMSDATTSGANRPSPATSPGHHRPHDHPDAIGTGKSSQCLDAEPCHGVICRIGGAAGLVADMVAACSERMIKAMMKSVRPVIDAIPRE